MKLKTLRLGTLLALGSLSFAGHAATTSYEFGNLLSGSYTPSGSFATLDVTTTDNLTYDFTLTALDLESLFTAGTFIGSMAVDVDGSSALPTASLTGIADGVTSIGVSPGGGPGGVYNFRYAFGGGAANRLTASESVSWTSTFDSAVSFSGDQLALHVQGLSDAQGGSAWYTPVPEPETYALMLAGLGLLGFIARRRLGEPAASFNFA